jgi:mono/diheme cytochrome c family protein
LDGWRYNKRNYHLIIFTCSLFHPAIWANIYALFTVPLLGLSAKTRRRETVSQLFSSRAGKLLATSGALAGLMILTLLLAACQSDLDTNSTAASLTFRPVTVVQGANPNFNPDQPGRIDPTKNLTIAAGATSTPQPPTPTPLPATATPVRTATTAAGGGTATTAAGGGTATTAAGGGATTTVAGVKGDATAGGRLFRTVCQSCHAQGGRAAGPAGQPNLSISDNAGNPDYIRTIVRNGKNAMAAYDKDTITDADLENLVAYVISIRAK